VKTNSAFKEGTDPEEKKTIIEGDVLCQERFHRHVEIHPNNTAPFKTASPASCGIINV
jgi:hypothetical protein